MPLTFEEIKTKIKKDIITTTSLITSLLEENGYSRQERIQFFAERRKELLKNSSEKLNEMQELHKLLDNETKAEYTKDEKIGLIVRGAYTGKLDYETAEDYFIKFCDFKEKRAKGTIQQLIIDKQVEYKNFMAKCKGEPQNFVRFDLPDDDWDD